MIYVRASDECVVGGGVDWRMTINTNDSQWLGSVRITHFTALHENDTMNRIKSTTILGS